MSEESPGSILDELPRSATLTQLVYDRLRRGLLVGFWAPGEKLSARQTAREMDVSLTPVREAMMRLANEGALELTRARVFQTPELSRSQYRELVRIRVALEPMAAELAAARMPVERIDEIEAMNERLAELIEAESYSEALEIDSEFHLKIYDQAGQPLLRAIIDSLLLRAGPTRTRLSPSYRKSLRGYEQHRRIIAALRARDGAAARAEIAADLSKGAEVILGILPE
ncbi:MAG: GntR family transcriptional regulator [Rhodospirillales bacterium]